MDGNPFAAFAFSAPSTAARSQATTLAAPAQGERNAAAVGATAMAAPASGVGVKRERQEAGDAGAEAAGQAQPQRKIPRPWLPVQVEGAAVATEPPTASDDGRAARPPSKLSTKYAQYRASLKGNTTVAPKAALPRADSAEQSPPVSAVSCPEPGGTTAARPAASSTGNVRESWRDVFDSIRRFRVQRDATVDAFHRFLLQLRAEPEGGFLVLVASLLSVQVRDNVAMAAMRRLIAACGERGGLTVQTVRRQLSQALAHCSLTLCAVLGRSARCPWRIWRRRSRL